MKRFAIFLLMLGVLAQLASAQDWTIAPGQAVGPIKLGMALSDIEAKTPTFPQGKGVLTRKGQLLGMNNGKKIIKYTRYGAVEVQWEPRAIAINILKPSINVNGREFNIVGPGGVRVGSTLQNVQTAMGQWDEARDLKPQKLMAYVYHSKGIYFVVNGNKVQSINVYQPTK